jgi:soluble P-type ATPase
LTANAMCCIPAPARRRYDGDPLLLPAGELYSRPCKKEIRAKIGLHYPEAERETIWEQVQRQYADFLSDWRTDLGGKRNFHNGVGGTYDCIAIMSYYTVCKAVTSFREIEEMEENLILPIFRRLRFVDCNKPFWRKLMYRAFVRAKGGCDKWHDYEMTVAPYETEKPIYYEFTSCPAAEFAIRHGLTDIMPALCNVDYASMELLHARLVRTTTCVDGCRCDYTICGDKDPYLKAHPEYRDEAGFSAHFVFEDEGCRIPEGEQAKFDTLPAAYSHLYLCIDGELAAVICIHDPLRREAREAVRALHESGFANVVMMTGDNRRTAETVAAEVGVDAVYAEVLPEDKAAFIRQEKAKGHTVIMVGDGVNDSPALSEADAGIAISTGAAIAREIADITVSSEDLFALVTLRRLSQALMERIHGSYRFIVGFNLALIALGVAGILPPTTSALLHNGSTLGIGLKNMTDLLDENKS